MRHSSAWGYLHWWCTSWKLLNSFFFSLHLTFHSFILFHSSFRSVVSTVFHSCTKNAQVYQQFLIVDAASWYSYTLDPCAFFQRIHFYSFTLLVCIVWFWMRYKNNIDRHHISKWRISGILLTGIKITHTHKATNMIEKVQKYRAWKMQSDQRNKCRFWMRK